MNSPRSLFLAAALAPALTSISAAAPDPAPATEAPAAAAASPVELATIDGKAITSTDVEQALRMRFGPQLDSMSADRRAMAIKQSTPQMAEELIARMLLLNAAKAAKVEADPKEIKETIDSITGSLPPQMTFADYLKSVGHDQSSFNAALAEELQISSHVRARLDAMPKASDDAVAKYYDEHKTEFVTKEGVKASHILLKTDPAAGDDGKKAKLAEIEKLRQQLIEAKGEGFDKVATEHSDCPSSAQGGDLGNFGRGQMVPEFEKAAFTQKPGEIGDVVETQFGYHLIKVTDKTTAGQRSLEDVKEEIAERLNNESQQGAVQSYLDELEKAAKITRSAALAPPAPPTPPAPPAPGN